MKFIWTIILAFVIHAASAQRLTDSTPVNSEFNLPRGGAPAYADPESQGAPTKQLVGRVYVLEKNRDWVSVQASDGIYFVPVWVLGLGHTRLPWPTDSVTGKITYTSIVQVSGASQAALFARATEWMARSIGSSRSVVELNDAASGNIIRKVLLPVTWSGFSTMPGGHVECTLSIFCKEGRYKYVVTEFRHKRAISNWPKFDIGPLEQAAPEGVSEAVWKDFRTQAATESDNLITSLIETMIKKADSEF